MYECVIKLFKRTVQRD